MSVELALRQRQGLSWKETAVKCAEEFGLGIEVEEAYEQHRASGFSEEESAWMACYDWDVGLELRLGADTLPSSLETLIKDITELSAESETLWGMYAEISHPSDVPQDEADLMKSAWDRAIIALKNNDTDAASKSLDEALRVGKLWGGYDNEVQEAIFLLQAYLPQAGVNSKEEEG